MAVMTLSPLWKKTKVWEIFLYTLISEQCGSKSFLFLLFSKCDNAVNCCVKPYLSIYNK